MKAWVIALALAGIAGAQAQQLYRWVDKDGGVHYTQQPPPPAEAREVQKRTLTPSAGGTGTVPYATQLAVRNYPVTLYSSPDCGTPCKSARESLANRGIPFKEVTVADNASIAELTRLSGKAQVPTLLVGTQPHVGFEADGWKNALDIAGYPASAPPIREQARAAGPQKARPAVKLYTSEQCGGLCDEARKVLAARRVPYQEVEVSFNAPETLEELKRVSGGETVPVLVVGERLQRGFDSATYHNLLEASGFHRAGEPEGAK